MGYFKIMLKSIAMELSSEMAYKWNFIIKAISLVFADIVAPLVALLIYSNTSGIPGWSFEEFVLFQGTLILIMGLNHLSQIMLPVNVMTDIREGTFDKYLIKPFKTLALLTVTSWDIEGAAEVVVGTGLVIWAMIKTGIGVFSLNFLAYLYLLVLAYIFFYCFMVLIASLGFLVIKSYALLDLFWKAADFARYPIDIYGPSLRLLLTFIFPMAVVSFYPATTLIRGVNLLTMAKATIPIVIIFILTMFAWSSAMKKYSSAGG
jgi:ABC-2 type transport system permease protein